METRSKTDAKSDSKSRFDLLQKAAVASVAIMNGTTSEAAVLVPENEWTVIPRGTRVQYKRRDGAFRSGGYVLEQWLEASPPHQGIYHVKFVLGHYTWVVRHSDIAQLWRIPGPPFGRPRRQSSAGEVVNQGAAELVAPQPLDSGNIQQRLAALEKELRDLKYVINGSRNSGPAT